jgi:hypothetical protein
LPGAEHGILAISEFHAPFGVPDLTVVVGDPTKRRRRLRLKVDPVLNEIDAGIVSALSDARPSSAGQIARRLDWPPATIERRLRSVLRSGAVREVAPDRFLRRAALQPIGTVFAIETKVTDWRRALTQCRTYRTWADGYVLVLDRASDVAASALRQEVARDRGGLIIADRWILRPRTSKLSPARRLWASEHIIAASRRPRPTPR